MSKKATNTKIQIQQLKDRGMIFEDEAKVKECLLDIGYYRLGFYWNPFEKDDEHNFIVQ
jgi:abortive infection bacteriophage resistance protein